MVPSDAVADNILRKVAGLVKTGDIARLQTLDAIPIAIYAIDANGFITYFNPSCIELAGRTPVVLHDRWCVTWKIYTNGGDFIPHHKCPMADAIRTKRSVRGITAIAERPDGSRINFMPFPTPVLAATGELLGAVNMLIDITGYQELGAQSVWNNPWTLQGQRLEVALATFSAEDIRDLIQEIEIRLGRRSPRLFN